MWLSSTSLSSIEFPWEPSGILWNTHGLAKTGEISWGIFVRDSPTTFLSLRGAPLRDRESSWIGICGRIRPNTASVWSGRRLQLSSPYLPGKVRSHFRITDVVAPTDLFNAKHDPSRLAKLYLTKTNNELQQYTTVGPNFLHCIETPDTPDRQTEAVTNRWTRITKSYTKLTSVWMNLLNNCFNLNFL